MVSGVSDLFRDKHNMPGMLKQALYIGGAAGRSRAVLIVGICSDF